MKVLIIDDEEDTRSICGMSLGLIDGAQVVEASSGSDGILLAAKEQPDVIILDLLMPEMDGTETLKGLRQNPDTAEIPVIFLTTKGMFPEFDGLRALGALAVLCKPFDPITIGTQIQKILRTARGEEDEVEPAEDDETDASVTASDDDAEWDESESGNGVSAAETAEDDGEDGGDADETHGATAESDEHETVSAEVHEPDSAKTG